MDSFSDVTSDITSSAFVLGDADVPDVMAQQDETTKINEVTANSAETGATKPKPSYKLTWKVEDGQLVRHWVEV